MDEEVPGVESGEVPMYAPPAPAERRPRSIRPDVPLRSDLNMKWCSTRGEWVWLGKSFHEWSSHARRDPSSWSARAAYEAFQKAKAAGYDIPYV
eukprot:tig00000955_g5787.t1